MRISDWSSDVCSSDLHSSKKLLEFPTAWKEPSAAVPHFCPTDACALVGRFGVVKDARAFGRRFPERETGCPRWCVLAGRHVSEPCNGKADVAKHLVAHHATFSIVRPGTTARDSSNTLIIAAKIGRAS